MRASVKVGERPNWWDPGLQPVDKVHWMLDELRKVVEDYGGKLRLTFGTNRVFCDGLHYYRTSHRAFKALQLLEKINEFLEIHEDEFLLEMEREKYGTAEDSELV